MARKIVLCGWLRLHNCSVSQLVTRQSGCYQLHIMAGCVICRAVFEKKTGGYKRKSFVSLLRKCSILVREALNLFAPSLVASLPVKDQHFICDSCYNLLNRLNKAKDDFLAVRNEWETICLQNDIPTHRLPIIPATPSTPSRPHHKRVRTPAKTPKQKKKFRPSTSPRHSPDQRPTTSTITVDSSITASQPTPKFQRRSNISQAILKLKSRNYHSAFSFLLRSDVAKRAFWAHMQKMIRAEFFSYLKHSTTLPRQVTMETLNNFDWPTLLDDCSDRMPTATRAAIAMMSTKKKETHFTA